MLIHKRFQSKQITYVTLNPGWYPPKATATRAAKSAILIIVTSVVCGYVFLNHLMTIALSFIQGFVCLDIMME